MQPETPAGEGAALIAATEQEIGAKANVSPLSRLATAAETWEATARRLAALLDAVQTPVQAATHGEAGEAHRGAQGCDCHDPCCSSHDATMTCEQYRRSHFVEVGPCCQHWAAPNARKPESGRPEFKDRPLKLNSADVYTPPGVQGAGRDWRGEIEAVIRSALERQAAHPGRSFVGWGVVAAEIVAALGLHDLEQAAAEARADVAKLWDATGIPADAEVDVDFVAGSIRTMLDTSRIARTQLRPQLARAEADAAAARRELEQLSGEVERIRVDLPAIAGRQPGAWGVANELDNLLTAALAASAPATQDGGPKA